MPQLVPAIEATNITRSLPLGQERIDILNGISFTVLQGEWVALTGPSGSGKSTLLGILAGLDSPTSGSIKLDGVDVTRLGEGAMAKIRNSKIGIVFQSFNLIESLTAEENVEVPLYVTLNRAAAKRRAREILDLVGLSDRLDHRPHQLSGGQQQRVAIARALVTRPSLLVADEPTGNLDSSTGVQVLDLMGRLRNEVGFTLVVATHDTEVAARADRHLHIVDGRLAEVPVASTATELAEIVR